MEIIISIDDTDNPYSKGTGFRARSLGQKLQARGYLDLRSISRHQLFFDPRIPYTSHNSSASLMGTAKVPLETIRDYCRRFLYWRSAIFSDAGLCIAPLASVNPEIIAWGYRAKKEVLEMSEALKIAKEAYIYLEGLRGKKIGLIGSLAATGLRAEGNDGRLLWLPNLRSPKKIFTAAALQKHIAIEQIIDRNGMTIPQESLILKTEWCRPVHLNGKISLIVDKNVTTDDYDYHIASKEYIKSISQ